MSKGRGGNLRNDGFTERTVMAMATEMAEARNSMHRACVVFAALAKSIGVPVQFEDHPRIR